jgi:hypothetical protein
MSLGWNIIKNNLNNFSKGNFVCKGSFSPLLQYFKCGSKGDVWLWGCLMKSFKKKIVHLC